MLVETSGSEPDKEPEVSLAVESDVSRVSEVMDQRETVAFSMCRIF